MAACLWLTRGVDLSRVSAWLGHASISGTNRNLHLPRDCRRFGRFGAAEQGRVQMGCISDKGTSTSVWSLGCPGSRNRS